MSVKVKITSILFIFLAPLLLVTSCKSKPEFDVNISSVQIDPVAVKRYEKALFTIDPENLREEIDHFVEDFYLFLGDEIDTEMGQQQLYQYITDPFIRDVYNDLVNVWPDVAGLEQQLTLAFRYFRYHFPQWNIPSVYSYVSGIDFEYPVFFQDDVLVIALDMFMGSNYPLYERVGIPAFKRVRFVPEAAAVEAFRTIGQTITRNSSVFPETLLDFMVAEGKMLYFLDAMFPRVADSLKIYYTREHMAWANSHERESWSFIINNEMLYSTDRQMIQKFVGDTPFTAPFSTVSAPRMGVFHGWQIVREYMRRNKDVTLEQLLFEKHDSREILSRSRYRP